MNRISLRNQIVLWAGACLLVSNFLGIAFSVYTLNNQAESSRQAAIAAGEEKAQASARSIATVYANEMNTALNAARAAEQVVTIGLESSAAAGTSPTPLLNRDQVTAMLKNILAANPSFLDIYSDWEPNAFDGQDSKFIGAENADMDGRFVPWWAWAAGELQLQPGTFSYQDEVTQDYFRLPKESKQDILLEPYSDMVDGKSILMTSLISPIMVNQKFLGISGVDIALSQLQSQVDQYAASLYGGTAEIEIISTGGLVVAHNAKPDWAGKNLQEVDPTNASFILAAIKSGQAIGKDNAGNDTSFVSFQPGATTTPWTVALSIPEGKLTEQADAAFAQVNTSLWTMVGLAMAGIVVALFILWQFATAFTRPIQAVASFLGMMAGGNVSQNVPQKLLARKDELGGLSQSVQSVAESLRRIFTELVRSTETLSTSSSRLLTVSDRTAGGLPNLHLRPTR